MNRFLRKIFFLILVPSCVFAQNEYFFNSSWADAIDLAKKKNQLLIVFVSPEKKHPKCDEYFKSILTETKAIQYLATQAIFCKVDFSKEDGDTKQFLENYRFKKPTIFFIDVNKKLRQPIELDYNTFDLENMYNCIFQLFRNKDNVVEIASIFHKKPDDLVILKKYLEFLNYTCKKQCVESVLAEYFKAISKEKLNSDESFQLLLKYQPSINTFYENLYLGNLQRAMIENDLYQQLIIKSLIAAGVEYTYSKKTLSAKKTLENNSNVIKKYNQISINFPLLNGDIYLANYAIINENVNKYIKEVGFWSLANADKFSSEVLKKKDSTLNVLVQNFILNNTSLSEEQKSILASQKFFFTESYANIFYYFALKVYGLAKNENQVDFALKYAKKAIDLSPNASRIALYGLLLSKNANQKLAYIWLLNAIELESTKNDIIDSRISNDVFGTFLNLQQTKYD